MNNVSTLLMIVIIQTAYALDNAESVGIIEENNRYLYYHASTSPEFINVETARADLKMARKMGNKKYAAELSQLIHNYWNETYKPSHHPATYGFNPTPGPHMHKENHLSQNGAPSFWGHCRRIDWNDEIYDAKITSLSTGELYSISIWDSSGNDHVLIHRSTNGGWTWYIYWNVDLRRDYEAFNPGISTINDTIVMWYILHRNSDNHWRTWFRTCLPGNNDNCIYYGSPTGGFNPVKYGYLHLTDDSPVYGTKEYLYAAWTETYGTGPDSTSVMFARSDEIDVSYWELSPAKLYSTSGANIYFAGTKIAFGSSSDMLWLTAWLHPDDYPSSFDRGIWGWYSKDYGGTWSSENHITPIDNKRDEYDQVLAGSHSNTNWAVLFTQVDTNFASTRDIYYCSSTDDSTWTMDSLVTQHDEFLSDIWVDKLSTAFYGTLHQDGSTFEVIKYLKGDINDPASWSVPVDVYDASYFHLNLSGFYGPSINRNMGNGDAIVAWTCCNGSVYSIWFASESWLGFAEEDPKADRSVGLMNLTPNPSNGNVKLIYALTKTGAIKISVYDALGRLVNNIVKETQFPGRYVIFYDNQNLPAGIYFVRAETADCVTTKTMTVVK